MVMIVLSLNKEVSFDNQMQSVKNMNSLLREKNNEILRNLQIIKDEIEFKNKAKQLQIKEAYTNLAENNRNLLNSLRTRNNNYIKYIIYFKFLILFCISKYE